MYGENTIAAICSVIGALWPPLWVPPKLARQDCRVCLLGAAQRGAVGGESSWTPASFVGQGRPMGAGFTPVLAAAASEAALAKACAALFVPDF